MDKNKLKKVRITQQMLQSVVGKINDLTSGNMSHLIPSIRSITYNINDVMVKDLIASCETKDTELKQLLEKTQRNVRGADNLLAEITPSTVDNGKKHLSSWIGFYANALDEQLKKYEM